MEHLGLKVQVIPLSPLILIHLELSVFPPP